MVIRVSIPSFGTVKDEDDPYTVFLLDIWADGQHNVLEKRYSEFEELHKKLKKIMKTPEFPPKKVMKWKHKMLEQRRLGLESYMKGVVENHPVPREIDDFLNIEYATDEFEKNEEELNTSQQPMVVFEPNAYLHQTEKGSLPDVVNEGVMIGLYSDTDSFIY